jgi:NTP pyrophosphatase (non-canonical NTP hydrolase)
MTSKLSDFQEYVGVWNRATFPDSTITGHVNHIRQEIDELDAELKLLSINPESDTKQVAEESADVFILLLSLAHCFKFDLMIAAADKMRVLQKRQWHPADGNGIHHHITEIAQ